MFSHKNTIQSVLFTLDGTPLYYNITKFILKSARCRSRLGLINPAQTTEIILNTHGKVEGMRAGIGFPSDAIQINIAVTIGKIIFYQGFQCKTTVGKHCKTRSNPYRYNIIINGL